MTWQTLVSSFAILAFGACVLGCPSGGVGDPCIPNKEFDPGYKGASVTGAQIEDRSFQCETRVCLVNHFQGRVSCPFGNLDGSPYTTDGKDDKGQDVKLPATCYVPGTKVKVDKNIVSPQCQERKDSVYCSCRCGGADTAAKYCDCPSGFACEEVSTSFGAKDPFAGDKYCVRTGDSYYNETKSPCKTDCDGVNEKCGYTENKEKL